MAAGAVTVSRPAGGVYLGSSNLCPCAGGCGAHGVNLPMAYCGCCSPAPSPAALAASCSSALPVGTRSRCGGGLLLVRSVFVARRLKLLPGARHDRAAANAVQTVFVVYSVGLCGLAAADRHGGGHFDELNHNLPCGLCARYPDRTF